MAERSAPFHCPYCGDDQLRPHVAADAGPGAWECRACLRAFGLSLIAHLPRPTSTPVPGDAR